jgi:predicted  nucleic acid-binding Zn-ribbon protein
MVGIMKMRCTACGHEWIPRSDRPPKKCPRCQNFHSLEVIGQQKNPETKEILATASTEELHYLRGVLTILRENDPLFADQIRRAVDLHDYEAKKSRRERTAQEKTGTR